MQYDDGEIIISVSGTKYNGCMAGILKGATGIRTITFPTTVREFVGEAFCEYASLRSAVLNEGLEKLGSNGRRFDRQSARVFARSGIRKVCFPSTLEEIGYSAFAGCKDLKGVQFPNGLKRIDVMAFQDSGIEEVALPPSVIKVSPSSFRGCTRLRSVCLNEGLEELGMGEGIGSGRAYNGEVFTRSALEKVQIPSTLKKIG